MLKVRVMSRDTTPSRAEVFDLDGFKDRREFRRHMDEYFPSGWRIVDAEGLPHIPPRPDHWTVFRMARLLREEPDAFRIWVEANEDAYHAAGTFAEAYAGRFESLEDYAEQMIKEAIEWSDVHIPVGSRLEVDMPYWTKNFIFKKGHVFERRFLKK